jgi:hypothetical protein
METSLLPSISISFIVPIDRLFAPRYLHKIFVARDGRSHRELWHDHVQGIDMTNENGGMTGTISLKNQPRKAESYASHGAFPYEVHSVGRNASRTADPSETLCGP